jgi:hypothetical protein
MEPVDEAVDDRAGKQIQLTDPREHRGIDESSSRDRSAFCQSSHFWVLRRRYIPDFGTATASSNWSTI